MLFRNTAIYAFARGGAGVLNFLAVVIYSRLLAPEEYGRYALLMATVAVASAVFFQWLRSGARRFLAAHTQDRAVFVGTLARGYGAIVLVAFLVTVIALVVQPVSAPRALVALGFLIFAGQGWYDLTLELLLVDLQPVRYGLVSLARSGVGVPIAVGMAAMGFGVVGVLTGVLLGYAIPPLLLARSSWGRLRLGAASVGIQRELLRYGLPLTATFALEFVVSSSDRFLLGTLAGVEEVGRYAVSYDLAYQSITAILMIVNLAAFPITVRVVEARGAGGAERELRQHGTALLLVAAPAAIALALLAPNVAEVLIGEKFRAAAAALLPLIATAAVLAGLKAYYFDLSYQLGRATGIQVWVSGAAALMNVLLNVWWIPLLGAKGAALATLAAYTTGCGLSWALGFKGLRLPIPWNNWVKILLAASVMGLTLWPLTHLRGVWALAIQSIDGIAVYGMLVLLLDVGEARLAARRAVGNLRIG